MDGYNVVGAAVMFVLAMGSYILLQLIAKSLERKKRKEWLERNSSGPFDLDR
jgi:hypothetical protein